MIFKRHADHPPRGFRARLRWFGAIAVLLAGLGRASATDARTVWTNNCAACHGEDGKGKTPQGRKVGAKDLTQSKLTDAELRKQIAEGAKNKRGVQTMPAFKDKLSPEEIEAVVTVLMELRR